MSSGEDTIYIGQGYIGLAAAIVDSGICENDNYFLQSEWCDFLKQMVFMNYEIRTTARSSSNIYEFEPKIRTIIRREIARLERQNTRSSLNEN